MDLLVYYSVTEIANVFRRSPRTIRDWILKGCPTPRGVVKLEAAKLGREWTVREDWLLLFEHRVRPRSGGRPELDAS